MSREHGRQCGLNLSNCHDRAGHARWLATFARGPQMVDGVPRRNRTDLATPAEAAIRAAMAAVEAAGADTRLTAAVMALQQALDAVADFVERDAQSAA